MSQVITTTLSEQVYVFLNNESKKYKRTKKSIIEEAINLYKKIKLENEVKKWLEERYGEYGDISNESFSVQCESVNQ